MANEAVRGFDQRKRMAFLWLVLPPLLFAIMFSQTAWQEGMFVYELSEQAGAILVFACVAGRCWSSLYIGARKNQELVTDGPYRHTRNPLYFFSALGMAGLGLMLGSLILAAALFTVTWLVFRFVARREAAFLAGAFGEKYRKYRDAVPEFLPSLRPAIPATNRPEGVAFSPAALRRTFIDASFFLLILPFSELLEFLHEEGLLATLVYLY
ncbi:MAG: isoprenylcysteine carboxylmethyltransferase family protein [Rhizobiaceae bacterium]